MPPTNTDEGIAIAATLRTKHPEIGVLLLSQYAEASYALTLLADGTARRGYLLKERVADGDELTDAIRRVADGGSVIDPTVIEGLVAANRAKPSELDALTPRELQVLGEMAQGKSNASIAATLVLRERAIEKHTNSIFSKLGLSRGARPQPPGERGAGVPAQPLTWERRYLRAALLRLPATGARGTP